MPTDRTRRLYLTSYEEQASAQIGRNKRAVKAQSAPMVIRDAPFLGTSQVDDSGCLVHSAENRNPQLPERLGRCRKHRRLYSFRSATTGSARVARSAGR